jgi:hypothetical protein
MLPMASTSIARLTAHRRQLALVRASLIVRP